MLCPAFPRCPLTPSSTHLKQVSQPLMFLPCLACVQHVCAVASIPPIQTALTGGLEPGHTMPVLPLSRPLVSTNTGPWAWGGQPTSPSAHWGKGYLETTHLALVCLALHWPNSPLQPSRLNFAALFCVCPSCGRMPIDCFGMGGWLLARKHLMSLC